MKSITSRDNPAYKAMARLAASAAERRRRGASVIDGAHLLAAYLDSGREPEAVIVSAARRDDPEIARLVARCPPGIVTQVSESLFDALSTVESPTGVLAAVKTPGGRPAPREASFVLLLEDIQDPGNVGTLLRSAAAAGVGHVLLSGRCAFAWSPKVLRAGMGAHFAVNIVEDVDLGAFLATFAGRSVALAGGGERSLYELDLMGPLAIVVGNEGAGLSPALQAVASVRARIPMRPPVESLNAGTAGSIALFEAVRQRMKAPSDASKRLGNHR